MYYVYVIQNRDGLLYKGYTTDIAKRIAQHNADDGFHSYTAKRGPWTLVYQEKYTAEYEAKKRERFLKSGKGRELLKRLLDDYPPQADG